MDLETEAKPRFLNHKDQRAWLVTDLEKGAIHEPPEPLLIASMMWYIVVSNATLY